jgi:hypothetical protein
MRHMSVLRTIYNRLSTTEVNWALTGSLSFALQGVPVDPNDIDLQTDEAGAYEVERRLAEFVVRPVALLITEKMRSHFGTLVIAGITVEIMGDIQKRQTDGTWSECVDLRCHKRFVEVEGMHIPVLSLEYEYEAYMMLGRVETAQLLQQSLQRMESGWRLP